MTEAEKKVVERAEDMVRTYGQHGPWEQQHVDRLRVALIEAGVDLTTHRPCVAPVAQPLAAPSAPDVEGLEKAVKAASDACVKAYEVWRDADGSHAKTVAHDALKDAEVSYYAAHHALDAARAARKPPGPALLTAEEAADIWVATGGVNNQDWKAVLSAAHERFVAAVEAGLEARGFTHDCVARTEFRQVCAALGGRP